MVWTYEMIIEGIILPKKLVDIVVEELHLLVIKKSDYLMVHILIIM